MLSIPSPFDLTRMLQSVNACFIIYVTFLELPFGQAVCYTEHRAATREAAQTTWTHG